MGRIIIFRLNLLIFTSLIVINLLGALMPELGFDALWYHLTLSKLFIFKHQWFFPGGLFYYSAMPRLAELMSLPLLATLDYVGPKLLQFFSGLVISGLIYKLTKRYTLDHLLSLVAANLFYATWLVSWQSASGYVDLVRTVFEVAAVFLLVTGTSLRRRLFAGLLFGLAIGVKWHALGSLFIAGLVFSPIIFIPAMITAFPWFLIAFHFTGNPLYPLMEKFMAQTQLAQVSPDFYFPLSIVKRLVLAPIFITKPTEDFLSPVFGLVYLLGLSSLLSNNKVIRRLSLYGVLGTGLFLLTPPPSTRYYLPYIPFVIVAGIYLVSKLKKHYSFWLLGLFTLSGLLVLSMRAAAFVKYFPYLRGDLSLNQFLASQSSRLPETFIDADDYVTKKLPENASYLITNLHNLYYFPYDFDHDSFSPEGKKYDYLVTKNSDPQKVNGQLLHTNPLGIQFFKLWTSKD